MICCHELASDQYQVVVNLVQYYQMETRWPIKRLLLHAFSAACYLDAVIVDILVTSVLPLEIVEDIKVQCDSLERLRELVKVLTLILSLGQPLPINHQGNRDSIPKCNTNIPYLQIIWVLNLQSSY